MKMRSVFFPEKHDVRERPTKDML